ncbi:MAG: IS21 family transposase, partial [Symploca sp. SIO3C6]|nr:IS21 family transposase [Symploca sp. SIO3C6]
LWQEGIERGEWSCSYGGFCRRYNKWKATHKLSMRQTYKSGEKVFVDYAGMTVAVIDPASGESNAAQIFVGCLAASNYTFAEATESQALGHWIGSHQRMLAFFGGVPKAIIPDNLKAGVTEACRYEPGVNRTYTEFAQHYGVAIIPARPYTPRDKAKVENAVQMVERQILAPLRHRRFTSMAQLNRAITERLEPLNDREMKQYGLSRRALFERTDQPALSPLPPHRFVLAQWKTAKVSPDYHIQVDYHYYSVPYWYVSRRVNVKITEQVVEMFYEHQRIASHPRSALRYRHSTVDEHMPPKHWEHQRQSKDRFVAWAEHIGPHTQQQVEAIFESREHDEQAFRSIKGIQRLASQYGCERLESACQRANAFGMSGLRRLKSILSAQLDEHPLSPPTTPSGPEHENVRGTSYYQ